MDGSDSGAVPATSLPPVITVAPSPSPTPYYPDTYLFLPVSGGLDAIFTPSPTPVPPTPSPFPVPGVHYFAASVVEYEFLNGWADGGGLLLKAPTAVSRWVTCESSWHLVTAGFYLSLVQFAPATWGAVANMTGYWDVYEPYQHGFNAATWAQGSDPGQQWPVCWWR